MSESAALLPFKPMTDREADRFWLDWCRHCISRDICRLYDSCLVLEPACPGFPAQLVRTPDGTPACTDFRRMEA